MESWIIRGRTLENQLLWTALLEKSVESSLDWKENKSVITQGNKNWLLAGQTENEAKAQIFSPSNVKTALTGYWWKLKAEKEQEAFTWMETLPWYWI